MSDITLHVAGVELGGWTSIRVSASLESAARTFGFELSTVDEFKLASGWVRPGTKAVVKIDGEPVVTGYATGCDYSYDKSSTTFTVEGASKTIDLVESDIITKPNRWRRRTLKQIILGLITIHGIELVIDSTVDGNTRVSRFKVAQGSKVFDAIDDLVEDYGLLVTDDEQGRLVLTRVLEDDPPKRSNDDIQSGTGGNALTGAFQADGSGLFSDYVCRGQQTPADGLKADGIALVSGSVTDQTIGRYRPLLIRPEKGIDRKRALEMARWRAANASGTAALATYTVGGWRQSNGELWKPGQLVTVDDDRCGIFAEMLIVDVDYLKDRSSGEVCQLQLRPPAAYVRLGPDERKLKRSKAKRRKLPALAGTVTLYVDADDKRRQQVLADAPATVKRVE